MAEERDVNLEEEWNSNFEQIGMKRLFGFLCLLQGTGGDVVAFQGTLPSFSGA